MTDPPARDAFALRVNQSIFYGWVMLAVAALGMFATGPGQSHLFSVFVTPISEDLEISRTSVSSAYALATLAASLGLPYVGRLIDRYGVRVVGICVAVAFGLAQIAFGAVANLVLLTLGFGALRFLGQGSVMLCCANLVSQWFSRRRGFALSLMALGFALSMAVHPPLAQWLTELFGWRAAWLGLAVLSLAVLLAPFVLLVQNRPEDLGLEPDGRAQPGVPAHPDVATTDGVEMGLTLKQAIRTSAFWIIAIGLGSLSMLVTALFFHQVSIFETQGLSAEIAARVFSISAVTMVCFMPIIGRMLDRFPTKPMFACALTTMAFALVAMAFVDDLVTAVLYSVVFGINNAAIQTHMTFMWPRFFGRRYLSSIQGAGQMIGVMAASIGPLPFGIYFDLYASYTGALLGLALLPVGCAVAVLFIRPPVLTRG